MVLLSSKVLTIKVVQLLGLGEEQITSVDRIREGLQDGLCILDHRVSRGHKSQVPALFAL